MQPTWIGETNPLDERKETYPECYGCGELLYDDETIAGDDNEGYCGTCIAIGFGETLGKGWRVCFMGWENGKPQFDVWQQ